MQKGSVPMTGGSVLTTGGSVPTTGGIGTDDGGIGTDSPAKGIGTDPFCIIKSCKSDRYRSLLRRCLVIACIMVLSFLKDQYRSKKAEFSPFLPNPRFLAGNIWREKLRQRRNSGRI